MEHKEMYRGYKIEISHDPNAENPLHSWDILGTFSCPHRRYNLSSKDNVFDDFGELLEYVKNKDVISLPIYLYDHSGIALSTSPFACKWDSGQVGYVHVTKQKVRKEFNWKIITAKRLKQIYEYLKGYVETMDDYVRGYVYGFTIFAPNGEEVDSVWGYFGNDHETNGILPECRSLIDGYIKSGAEEWKLENDPPGWICTDSDNMQFAKQVNETTWMYRQLNDDIELTCSQYLHDLERFQQTWFTDIMWEEKTIDANAFTSEEKSDEISGYYTEEQFAEFSPAEQIQLFCECFFENNLNFVYDGE